jgi:hypothetical protein
MLLLKLEHDRTDSHTASSAVAMAERGEERRGERGGRGGRGGERS